MRVAPSGVLEMMPLKREFIVKKRDLLLEVGDLFGELGIGGIWQG
jgi:hypothetical protein